MADFKTCDLDEALSALWFIGPSSLKDDAEWYKVTMAAKMAGIAFEAWDEWCRQDLEKYDKDENLKRWESAKTDRPGGITKKTLFWMAGQRGWRPTRQAARPALPDVEAEKLPDIEAARKVPAAEQLQRWLQALHGPVASVAVVTDWKPGKDGKAHPKGYGQLRKVGDAIDDPDSVLSAADPKAGAWVTLNEYDPGRFAKDHRKQSALSSFRYALIEADQDKDGNPIPLEEQLHHAARLRLPVRAAVWSGGKSLHLACAVDAKDATEFRKRAKFLASYCTANGFPVDESTTDPGRLSRLPGVMRDGKQQTLLWAAGEDGEDGSGSCWTASWDEWHAWAEEHDEPAQGEQRHDSGAKVPIHRLMANTLLDEFGACIIDGTPAVRDGQAYHHEHGWGSWERALVRAYPNSRTHERNEAINLAKCECRRVEQAPPEYIAFRNGVLNIETGKLDTQGKYPILNVIPHDWDPEAASEAVDNALEAWSDGDPETIARLEECAGQCLDRSSELQFFWCLVGEGGNGKSLFAETIGYAIGRENSSAIQPDELDRRFQGLSIAGKLACLADDASSAALTAGQVATLKRYTGGATVRSDVKGRDPIEFVPYATVIMSYNHFPRVTSFDGGFMRRIQPVVFSHTFKPGAGGAKAARELKSEQAAERLLVRAVAGLKRLRENGEPTPSSRARAVVEDIRLDNDSFEAWREDKGITSNSINQQRPSDVLADYRGWCDVEHMEPLSRSGFYRRVRREWSIRTTTTRVNGRPTKVYEIVD